MRRKTTTSTWSTRVMKFASGLLLLVLACSPAEADSAPSDAMGLLKKAATASLKLKALAYDGRAYGDGALATLLPKVSGKVVAQRSTQEGRNQIFIQGVIQPAAPIEQANNPAARAGPSESFVFATDGSEALRINEKDKVCASGQLSEASRVLELPALVPTQYLSTSPFDAELSAFQVESQPAAQVDGVDCDVVLVRYDSPDSIKQGKQDRGTAKFYFGKKDSLIRRIERGVKVQLSSAQPPTEAQVVFHAAGLNAQPTLDEKLFKPRCPEGFQSKTFREMNASPPSQPGQAGTVAVGAPAPDWELKDSTGKTVSLKSLRGKVVLMDFWATWCGPCKIAMPSVQKLHDRFKDKPVMIYGVNCWERGSSDRALDYIKQKGYTYPQLINGDAVAMNYNVRGIPTFYLIDPEGKVLYTSAGFHPQAEEMIAGLIEKSLKK